MWLSETKSLLLPIFHGTMKNLVTGIIIWTTVHLWSNQNVEVGHKYEQTEDKRKRSVRPFTSQVPGYSTTSGHFPVNEKSRVLVLILSLPVCNLSSLQSSIAPALCILSSNDCHSPTVCSAVYQTFAWT